MMRRICSSPLVAMLAVATLIAVGAIHRLEGRPPFPRIIIGIGPDAGFTQFVVGVEEDIFTRQGIDASTQLFPAGPATLEAELAGNADVGSASQFTFAAMLQKSGNFKIILQICTSGNMQCVVAEADIVKPRDLLGRTVATRFGAICQYHADRFFERFGLDASKIRMKNVAYGQIVPAFAAGDMDAFFAFEPHCTRGVAAAKGYHILNRSGDVNVVLARAYAVVNEKIYANRAFGIAFVRALVEAGRWITSNPDKAPAYLSTEFNIPAAEATRFIGYIDFAQVNFDQSAREELRTAFAYSVKLKGLPAVRDMGPIVTIEFIDAVKLQMAMMLALSSRRFACRWAEAQ
jgi:ABC-type nitrate/sulfonate/bicarbonate transport system substrate-binding protein